MANRAISEVERPPLDFGGIRARTLQPERLLSQPLSILFEDAHCLALNKPAGQFVQGEWAPPGDETLETAARRYLDPVDPGAVYLGIVHRLDRPTSGLILWAKTEKAARRLATQFQRRRAVKEYWAIVESPPPESSALAVDSSTLAEETRKHDDVWVDWLTRPDKSGQVSAVDSQAPGARMALTRWRTGQARSLPAGCSWLRLWPETGRTHQLRLQAARRGMPVLGDTAYGATLRFGHPERIALHARSLALNHPTSGQALNLVAPVPEWWAELGVQLAESSSRE
jgi:23S rRNA pseudouridine1911/1915/1917 synthase